MSETVGSSMSSVRSIEQSLPVRQAAAPVQTDASNAAAAKQVAQTAVKSASQAQAQNQAAAAASKPAAAASSQTPLVGNASSFSLQFRVDDKTKDVTVFVVDRSSKKVLRTIPASELNKLSAGDLLKLTA